MLLLRHNTAHSSTAADSLPASVYEAPALEQPLMSTRSVYQRFNPLLHACRCMRRSLPASVYEAQALEQPLMSTRAVYERFNPLLGEDSADALDPVERLLRNENPDAHDAIAGVLWESNR